MFKTPSGKSTTPRRVRMATSVARSHANATTGPRPTVPRPITAVTELGPSRCSVASPEQPIELRKSNGRSHSQDRDARMTESNSLPPMVFVVIDVALDKLDLARSDSSQVVTIANNPE